MNYLYKHEHDLYKQLEKNIAQYCTSTAIK